MFHRKKFNPPLISPLPPPASTSTSNNRASIDQHQYQHNYNHNYQNGNEKGDLIPPASTISRGGGGGGFAGSPVDRVQSNSNSSVKSEKRKSGLFGFGKKDKDKDKDKEKEVPRPRPSSFSVDRPPSNRMSGPGPGAARPSSTFSAQSAGSINGPQRQSIIPEQGQPSRFQPNPQQQQRNVSAPGSGRSNDFDPSSSAPGGQVPKSQSMGFAPRQSTSGPGVPVPDTHPYRGFLNGQAPQQQQQQSLPRSSTMPIDRQGQSSPPVPPASQSVATRTNTSSPLQQQLGNGNSISNGNTSPKRGKNPLSEFDRIVELIASQPQKTYVASPPELQMILARTSAGGQPKQGQPGSVTNDWDSVWLQLSGISLSMWSMKETRAAAAKGEKVPPTYFNITDSSLELLAPLPPPPHRAKDHPHNFVFSLNTAGSNRLLFSCPSERDLARWTNGLRLAAWERARLEEVYTGHLIKSGGREPVSTLTKGRLEGWVRARVMGGTDWKRLWVVLTSPASDESKEDEKKGRRRSFFGMGDKNEPTPVEEPNTGVCMASFYTEQRTAKNRTSVVPILTITDVTQTYAVFPERLEVITQSNLFKIVGRVSGDMVTIEGRLRDSGWALMMPETTEAVTNGSAPAGLTPTPLANMMRWVTAFHDVFKLYGRPERYSWDMQDPKSLFFAYPTVEEHPKLFLDLDEAVASDFRTGNLAAMRAQFTDLVGRRMRGETSDGTDNDDLQLARPEVNYRLPPLTFGQTSPHVSEQSVPRSLTPITEQSIASASRANSTATTKTQSTVGLNGDRKPSGSSSKQGSSGSSKHMNLLSGGEDRLEPIADQSTETFGQLTEEPSEAHHALPTPPFSPNTTESRTGGTLWSQDSGATPTPQDSQVNSPATSQPLQESTPTPTPPATAAPARIDARSPSSVGTQSAKPSSPLSVAPPLAPPIAPQVLSPTPRRAPSFDKLSQGGELIEEPAALYLMNMVEEPATRNLSPSPSPERLRPTINTDLDPHTKLPRNDLGRKPSGARAPPPKKNSGPKTLETISDERVATPPAQPPTHAKLSTSATQADLGEDVSAFINYADNPLPAKPKTAPPVPKARSPEPINEMRSSFAPSQAAVERRAKAEQAAADQERAKHLPGAGRRTKGQYDDSSEEEEDEEEEEEEEEDGLSALQHRSHVPGPGPNQRVQEQPQRSVSTRALPPVPRPMPELRVQNGPGGHADDYEREREREQEQEQRPRLDSFYTAQQMPTSTEQQYSQSRSPRSPGAGMTQSTYGGGNFSPAQHHRNLPPQPQAQNQAGRHTVWNANFSADHGLPSEKSNNGKFVELDEPAQLTKAFAPHGLLQAGMQDKEDRSAKKQEELARETGSSLINVPAKPPPPQMGLLGAVAAHERDRKNAGGIGATLTDREREKRLAEDRQREIEKLQRQQMEHMRQFGGGDMYGGQNQGYPSPYGMGMGMGGMGGMGMMMPPLGYPQQYQGGYNPYAQQQAMMAAQMAYQQAMMMSSGNSQAGGGGEYPGQSNSPGPGQGREPGQQNENGIGHGSGSPVGSIRGGGGGSPVPGYGNPHPHMSFYGSPSPAPPPMSMPWNMGIPPMAMNIGMGMGQMPWGMGMGMGMGSGTNSPYLQQPGQPGQQGQGSGFNFLSPNMTGHSQPGFQSGSSDGGAGGGAGSRSRLASMNSEGPSGTGRMAS